MDSVQGHPSGQQSQLGRYTPDQYNVPVLESQSAHNPLPPALVTRLNSMVRDYLYHMRYFNAFQGFQTDVPELANQYSGTRNVLAEWWQQLCEVPAVPKQPQMPPYPQNYGHVQHPSHQPQINNPPYMDASNRYSMKPSYESNMGQYGAPNTVIPGDQHSQLSMPPMYPQNPINQNIHGYPYNDRDYYRQDTPVYHNQSSAPPYQHPHAPATASQSHYLGLSQSAHVPQNGSWISNQISPNVPITQQQTAIQQSANPQKYLRASADSVYTRHMPPPTTNHVHTPIDTSMNDHSSRPAARRTGTNVVAVNATASAETSPPQKKTRAKSTAKSNASKEPSTSVSSTSTSLSPRGRKRKEPTPAAKGTTKEPITPPTHLSQPFQTSSDQHMSAYPLPTSEVNPVEPSILPYASYLQQDNSVESNGHPFLNHVESSTSSASLTMSAPPEMDGSGNDSSQDGTLESNSSFLASYYSFPDIKGKVTLCAFDSSGKFLATVGASDHSIYIYDTFVCRLVRVLPGHSLTVTGILFSRNPDTSLHLISCSLDASIRVWNIVDEQDPVVNRFDHTHPLQSIDCHPHNFNQFFCTDDFSNVIAWDILNYGIDKAPIFVIPDAGNRTIRFSPSGAYMAVSNFFGQLSSINIIYVHERQLVTQIIAHERPITTLLWASDEDLISLSEDCINVWKFTGEGSECVATLALPGDKSYSAVVHPHSSGTLLIGAYMRIYQWNYITNKRKQLICHDGLITHLDCNADGSLLASASSDGLTKLWKFC